MALEEAGRSRAELARDKAALVVQLTASERENAVLSEELAAFRCVLLLPNDICIFHMNLCGVGGGAIWWCYMRVCDFWLWLCRSERESLETSLFEGQQQLIQMESRREQLETENQNLRVRCETAAGEWARGEM